MFKVSNFTFKEWRMSTMKRNLVLVTLALMFGFVVSAVPAMGQAQFNVAGGNQIVRGEGHTEAVNSVTLQAPNGGNIANNTTINVDFSGTVTNTPALANLTCMIGGVAGCPPTWTVVPSGNRATITVTPAVVLIAGDYITLSRVRVDVAGLGIGITTVYATLSSSPPSALITYNPTSVPVGVVISHSITVEGTKAPMGVLTCNPPTAAGIPANTFVIDVTETTQHAYTTKLEEQGNTDPTLPVVVKGTQIIVEILGVPKNLAVSWDALGAGHTALLTFTQVPPISKTSTGPTVPVVFTFDITGDTAGLDVAEFEFSVYVPATKTLGFGPALITATAKLGPVGDLEVVPSTTVPLLFADMPYSAGTVDGVSDCITSLLFPWVVVEAPGGQYDTGIAIANTSKDVFTDGAAVPQTGSCALTGFKMADGSTVTMTPALGPIAGGATGTVVLSTHPEFAGFNGYVIAVCGFQNGHAFAYITDEFAGNRATQGYLALVIPSPSLVPRSPAGGGAGESLDQ
jgi:hypothetical protein